MRTLVKAGLLHASLAAALLLSAQETTVHRTAPYSVGTVSGTVVADTRLPARDAEVHLIQVGHEDDERFNRTQTDLDGKFFLPGVPEGAYYAFAVLPGYLNLLRTYTQYKAGAMPDEVRNWMESYVPIVTVTAGQPVQVTLQLERADEIAGTVQYDDGSPAIGLRLDIESEPEPDGKGVNEVLLGNEDYAENPLTTFHTDERGRYRIPGVSPGKYLVSVSLPTYSADPSAESAINQRSDITSVGGLTVYFGDSLRMAKAKPIVVGVGSSPGDSDITIPLSKLHTIHGHVALKSSDAPPTVAWVRLLYADPARRHAWPSR